MVFLVNHLVADSYIMHEIEQSGDAEDEDENNRQHTFEHKNGSYWARLDRFYHSRAIDGRIEMVNFPRERFSDHLPVCIEISNSVESKRTKREFGSDVVRLNLNIIKTNSVIERITQLAKAEISIVKTALSKGSTISKPWTACLLKLEKQFVVIYQEISTLKAKERRG